MNRRIRAALLFLPLALSAVATNAPGTTLYDVEGFEDDVDIVISPDRQFMVVPTESEDGSSAHLLIFDLDPNTGQVLSLKEQLAVLGWENGVDPFILKDLSPNAVVVAPTESEDGSSAKLFVFQVASDGSIVPGKFLGIDLGNLGFEDDVDGAGIVYPSPDPGAIFPLQKEDRTAAGIITVRINDDADFGNCTLVATDVRTTQCDDFQQTTPAMGWIDGDDGVAFQLPTAARYAIPVKSLTGAQYDLLLDDWDFSPPHPEHLASTSVKALNAGTTIPLPFPGYERDVDIGLMSACRDAANFPLLVPVEDAVANQGDLYLISGFSGIAQWRYNLVASPTAPRILGYEEGVDVVPWCNLGGAPDDLVVVPSENAKGTDADVLLLDMSNGTYSSSFEARNPPRKILGFEKGVEPLRWATNVMLIPVDDEHGRANLLSINPTSSLVGFVEDPGANPSQIVLGFERSVDPFVMPVGDLDRTLFVPVEKQDGSDSNLLVIPGPGPGFAGGVSFEAANAGVTVPGYERDVDPIRVNKFDGYGWIYVPEESPSGALARLRVQDIPGSFRGLALPTEGAAGTPKLYFVNTLGTNVQQVDVHGFELGLDPSSRIGDTLAANPPETSPRDLGFDADGDNTMTMENSYFGDLDGDGHGDPSDCAPRDAGSWGFPAPVLGLWVDHLSGVTSISWSSQAGMIGAGLGYDLATGTALQLAADEDYQRAMCLSDDWNREIYSDTRMPASGDALYYFVRAQNACGTGTYGRPVLDAPVTCP